ncbi:MAG TPA: J domain-containing protein [Chthoniobacteraceae bacterium]|jgi:hypothetical protein|nr:J domain-containing protein [Chthoniobacteraceae bacterium]
MKRPPKRRPARGVPMTPWIVLVDETPLRDAVMRDHHKLEEQSAAVRAKIERFETADLPAYTRWESRVLGPLLTAIREAESAIARQRTILEAVEDEQFFRGCSRLAAYRRVMRAMERGPEPEEEPPPDWGAPPPHGAPPSDEFGLPPGFDAADFDLMSPERQRAFREEYAIMAEMYEMMTGMVAPDLDELLRASRKGRRDESRSHGQAHRGAPPPHAAPPRHAEPNRASARIKELYRLLVRKLHPDLNPDQPARDRELWHTVQEAYNRRDVEALEAAAARVEVVLNGQAGKLSISLLRRLVTDLKKALSALKTKFASLRKHPAFDFAARNTASLAKFEERHRKQLERSLRGLQSYLADLTTELDSLAARAAKPKAGKKRSAQAEFF